MNQTKNYYKVVCSYQGRRLSYLKSAIHKGVYFDEDLIVEYKPDEWAVPKFPNSKLFVFDNRAAANDFAFGPNPEYSDLEIWKCEVRNPARIYHRLLVMHLCKQMIEDFWNDTLPNLPTSAVAKTDCDAYVCGCDALKLVERIK
jgi:hypothetical protein